MLERGLSVRRARSLAVLGAAILASLALSAAASGSSKTATNIAAASGVPKTTTKMCGSGTVCKTSLSSAPALTIGSGGGGGGGGGSSPPPQKPSSMFNVSATAASPVAQPITSGSQMVEKLDQGRRLTCLGYRRQDASWFAFMLNTQTSIHITYRVTDTITDTPATGVHFCLGAPYRFRTLSGDQARRSILPDGTLGYTGLLPLCNATATATATAAAEPRPCVVSARTRADSSTSTGFDTDFIVRVPAVTKGGDPWGGG